MLTLTQLANELNILIRLNWKKHALLLLIYAIYVAFFHYGIYQNALTHSRTDGPLFVFLIVVSLDVFKQLRQPVGSIQYLLAPAQKSAKFLAAWLYSFLMVIIAFVVTYNLTHLLCVYIFNTFTPVHFSIMSTNTDATTYLNPKTLPFLFQNMDQFYPFFVSMMGTHATFFLGSVFFRKNPFIKTLLASFGLGLLQLLLGYIILKIAGVDLTLITIDKHAIETNIAVHLQQAYLTYKTVFEWIFPFICWYLAYLTLKLKQV
jgi:hypothetical protein